MSYEFAVLRKTTQYFFMTVPFMYLGSKLTFNYLDPIGEIRRQEAQDTAEVALLTSPAAATPEKSS